MNDKMTVPAEVVDPVHGTVIVDVAPWLRIANVDLVMELARSSWMGTQPDEAAIKAARSSMAGVYSPAPNPEYCLIQEPEVLRWLERHRPEVYALVVDEKELDDESDAVPPAPVYNLAQQHARERRFFAQKDAPRERRFTPSAAVRPPVAPSPRSLPTSAADHSGDAGNTLICRGGSGPDLQLRLRPNADGGVLEVIHLPTGAVIHALVLDYFDRALQLRLYADGAAAVPYERRFLIREVR